MLIYIFFLLQEQQAEKKALEAAEKQRKKGSFLGMLNGNKKEHEGSIEFSLAGLFKVMCCIHPKPNDMELVLMEMKSLRETLDKMKKFVSLPEINLILFV